MAAGTSGPGTDVTWRKAKASRACGNCVEVGQLVLEQPWRKSRRSINASCVEVARGTQILVRDTKYAAGGEVSPVLAFPPGAWREFTAGLKFAG
jgi:NAD(P)H-nitrite reductase large subunit